MRAAPALAGLGSCPDLGTRVIYPANAREVTLELTNKGSTPSLVQVWIDAGDRRIRPGAEALPFLVTPPITRIEAQRGQSLRLAYVGQGLPRIANRCSG